MPFKIFLLHINDFVTKMLYICNISLHILVKFFKLHGAMPLNLI